MIQQIRYPKGLNEDGGGGHPQVLEQRYVLGMNTVRAPQYPGVGNRITMGDAAAANIDPAFAGCTNDTQLSFFMGKLAFSWALRGLIAGIALGAGGAAVGIYFLNKSR